MRWTWQQFHDAGGNGLRKLARADLVEEVRGELLSPHRVNGLNRSRGRAPRRAADDRLPSDHLPPSRGGAAPC
jgi:hypothetical protein